MGNDNSQTAVPRHVAIIMDGNGRWAQNRKLGRIRGHMAGIDAVRSVVKEAGRLGIETLTLFAFSSQNWGRPITEVRALMELMSVQLKREIPKLIGQGVRLKAIGQLDKLPKPAQKVLESAIEQTSGCKGLTLVLALSYGGRDEILEATRKILRENPLPEEVDESYFKRFLYDPELPDPDLLIRTSGENRISNFLLWQIAYTEIYITDVMWPDFGPENLRRAIEDYAGRKRRFGLTDDQLDD